MNKEPEAVIGGRKISSESTRRKAYAAPKLEKYGSISKLTASGGVSAAEGASGMRLHP
jgi:hypothetical protein